MTLDLLSSRRQYVTSEELDPDYDAVAASGLLWTLLPHARPVSRCIGHMRGPYLVNGRDTLPFSFLPKMMMVITSRDTVLPVSCSRNSGRDCLRLLNGHTLLLSKGHLHPSCSCRRRFRSWFCPGDKLFQSRDVSPDFQMAPITHAYGGSKTRVGKALRMV